MKTLLIALCLCTTALAQQKIVVVECSNGHAETKELNKALKDGWRVVAATPVTDSDSVQVIGKPKQAYTASIVYIIEAPQNLIAVSSVPTSIPASAVLPVYVAPRQN